MLKYRWIVLLLIIMLSPTVTQAQDIELAAFAGFRFSSDLEGGYDWEYDEFVDYDVDNGPSYGLTVSFPLSKHFLLELLWSRQNTDLTEQGTLFGDQFRVGDIDIDYYHVGVVYQWRLEKIRPFVLASIGATELSPDPAGLHSDTYFSTGWGGGVKFLVSEHFGVQLEGRLFATFLDDYDNDDWDWDCGHHDCCWGCDDNRDVFAQNEFRVGLIWCF
ncbi:MAG: porin family protein [bacterium]|nr:porin family protein [bacterium]